MFQAEEATTVKALRWKHSSTFHEQQAARGPEQNEQGEAARPRSLAKDLNFILPVMERH